jgi:hypothetical protein
MKVSLLDRCFISLIASICPTALLATSGYLQWLAFEKVFVNRDQT